MNVSVIIPVFNAEQYLADTLESVFEQSYTNFEVIIVDDHSTDHSWDIALSFCEKDERFKAFKNTKKGAASARNYGFSLSTGSLIQYLDADDILHREKIETQLDYINNNNFRTDILVACEWQFFSGDHKNVSGPIYPAQGRINTVFSNKDWLIQKPNMALMAWLFSRSQIESINGWNEDLTRNDDGELLYRVLAKVKEIHIIPKLLVYYRREDVMSLSKGLCKESLESWVASAITYKRVLSEIAPSEGRESSDKFMFFLYYICLLRDADLAKKCYTELYEPKNIYEVGDDFVFKLTNLTNLKFAKIVRRVINTIRGLDYV